MKRIKIGILAPGFLPIPPKRQGGTEWIVYHMAEGFVKKGYEVFLFASSTSKTSAHLIPVSKKGASELKLNFAKIENSRLLRLELIYITNLVLILKKRLKEFNIVFNHTRGGYLINAALNFPSKIVNILHLPIFKELAEVLKKYKVPLISISNSQRKGFTDLNFVGTVYNGVDTKKFRFNSKPKNYFFFIGSIRPNKGADIAVKIAKKMGLELILAGKAKDPKFFQEKIKPYLSSKIKYIGEIGFKEKIRYYQNAKALLFPIRWEEPFGLVMIESMACGTPVIAFDRGSVREVIKDKKTGFIVKNEQGMVKAIKKIDKIRRENCREWVEENFTSEKMVNEYEKIMLKLINNKL